ncbi:sensor histidine kinase [Pseudooceanicola nanhaiensis]|uniref:sensor histidine kinase n=1 Tax=Pseudooceanicola nanhaiensis TaxID=375761 RepID=UPI001CD4E51F|nr:PAS domain S-box protein [Pseudooceanicola nanhaiensis]MCA0919647.1 PAS domain S-box protein [Pseudooceanicola nanhaiensis]
MAASDLPALPGATRATLPLYPALAAADEDTMLQQYRMVLDLSPTPLLLCRPDGVIAMANDHLTTMFRHRPGSLDGLRIDLLVPEAARQHHPAQREAFLHRPAKRRMGAGRDLFGLTADGHLLPVEIGLEPLPVGPETWILATVLDISERKNGERRLRSALDSSASAMMLIDAAGRITLVNSAACTLAGAPEDDLLGRSVETFLPPALRKAHAVYRKSFGAEAEARAMGANRDLTFCRPDGTEVPVEIALTPIDGPDGTQVMATIVDITERLAHEAALNDRNEVLTQLNEELTQFAYSASHDLKAPLATIAGLLELALEDLDAGAEEDGRHAISEALQSARRNAAKVEAVLALARTGQQAEPPRDVALEPAIRGIWDDLTGSQSDPPVLTIQCLGDPVFRTNPQALLTVLENLLSNACRFRDPGKPDHWVNIRLDAGPNGLSVVVSDNGPGIAPEHREEVFSMFRTFATEGGHGLGLALVHKHLRRLGGTIRLESSPEGTDFHVFLPPPPVQKEPS